MFTFGDIFGLSRTPKTKQKKKVKKTYNNWFEKCNLEELKALCRASKLPVSGTKDLICDRLCHGELSSIYAYEYAPEKFSRARMEYEMSSYGGYGSGGENYYSRGNNVPPRPAQQGSKRSSALTNEQLKTKCREKGLIVSGKRYELVLRLLQAESGIGGAPKRAASSVDENDNIQPKKRAKTMKLPDPLKLKERCFKKMCPSDKTQSKWSNNKWKYHPSECVEFAAKIISNEVFEKELFQRGEEKLAWEVINAVMFYLVYGDVEAKKAYYAEEKAKNATMFFAMTFQLELGRCNDKIRFDLLPNIAKAVRATSSKDVVEELSGKMLWDFEGRFRGYGISGEVWDAKTSDFEEKKFKELLEEYVPNCKEGCD